MKAKRKRFPLISFYIVEIFSGSKIVVLYKLFFSSALFSFMFFLMLRISYSKLFCSTPSRTCLIFFVLSLMFGTPFHLVPACKFTTQYSFFPKEYCYFYSNVLVYILSLNHAPYPKMMCQITFCFVLKVIYLPQIQY